MSFEDFYAGNTSGALPSDSMATGETGYLPDDIAEAAKMGAYSSGAPATTGQQPAAWWESLVMYGATRMIDNRYPGQSTGTMGNTSPGTIAGQNGRTYTQQGGAVAPAQAGGLKLGLPLILGGLLLAYFVTRKG
ncbi:hypothetical protein [Sphaerotilus mobilis]|nr:hypothetical protein [Sphaerotilus mobilis]